MDERVNKSELEAANTRIRQLEGEVARYRAVNENARAERAFRCLEAHISAGGVTLQTSPSMIASMALNFVIATEQALAAQVERERA